MHRLRAHVASGDAELLHVRQELVSFLQGRSCSCDSCDAEITPGQPFLLNAWHALGQVTGDVDSKWPQLLEAGVPIGIFKRVDFSGNQ